MRMNRCWGKGGLRFGDGCWEFGGKKIWKHLQGQVEQVEHICCTKAHRHTHTKPKDNFEI